MLTFVFEGKCGKMEVPEKLISGTYGKQVLLEFSSDWDGLRKTAVFMALDGSTRTAYSVDVTQEILVIPAAVLANPEHTLYVQIQGFSPDGTEIINTGRIKGPRILPGINTGELPEMDAENPVWYEVLSQIGDLAELKTDSQQSLVSAINELALIKAEDGASAYEIAQESGFEGTETQWLDSLSGKSAYEYALDAGFIGSEEDFTAQLLGSDDICIVDLVPDDEGSYSASKTYYEIAHARAMKKLVILQYGAFITHILAGEPTEGSFLFEPLLHSVEGMPGYTVDMEDNWAAVPIADTNPDTAPDDGAADPWNGHEVVIYGVSDDAEIYRAVMSGGMVFCRYDDLYYLPLVSWAEGSHTAVFGGCYGDTVITCTAEAGEWSVEEQDAAPAEADIFVGTAETPLAKFLEAFNAGKACFLKRERENNTSVMYAVSCVTNALAHLSRTASTGLMEYGYIDSSGNIQLETKSYSKAVDEKSTDAQIPTAKAVREYAQPKGDYLTQHQDISGKLDKNLGSANAGKILIVGTDGNLTLADMPEGGVSGDVTGVLDESNNILLSGALADGTYTLKYENGDGTYSEIGTLEVGVVKPAYTNLAEPNTTNTTDYTIWCNEARLAATGAVEARTEYVVSNFVKIGKDQTLRFKGITLQRMGCFNASKNVLGNGCGQLSTLATNWYIYDDYTTEDGMTTVRIKNADVAYIRISGQLTGTADDVIITVDQAIA